MNTEVKKQIIEAAKTYAAENGLTQADMAAKTGLNDSYISAMWNGNFTVHNNKEKATEIKPSHFKKLARVIGYAYEAVYWETVDTNQYLEITAELLDAKNSRRMKMLIGETGCGKTYTVAEFKKRFPANTFCITVSSLHTLDDIINELCGLLKVKSAGSRVSRMKRIAVKLGEIEMNGGKPVMIIDECENLRLPALKMLKGLYDAVKEHCSIVLVGTSQLAHKLDILNEKDIEGIPQFCRRFKAGTRNMPSINKSRDFVPFLEKVDDKGLRLRLQSLCNNYGELNDFIEPALREADKMGCELTEDFVVDMFGLNRA